MSQQQETQSHNVTEQGLELSQVHTALTSPADGDDCGDCPQSSSSEGASLLHVLAVDPARCSSDVSVRDTLQRHPLFGEVLSTWGSSHCSCGIHVVCAVLRQGAGGGRHMSSEDTGAAVCCY